MTVIVEFSVAPDSFGMSETLSIDRDVEVSVEKIVPVGDGVMPFSWVSGDLESFERGLRDSGVSYESVVDDEARGRRLYRFEWEADEDALIRAILDSGAAVLSAVGTESGCEFSVRFEEHDSVSGFRRACERDGVTIDITRVYSPVDVSDGDAGDFTATQTRTLLDALEAGYFEIPRKTSLVELAERYDVSDQAVSERIRRATAKLIRSALAPDREEEAQEAIEAED